MLFGAFEITYDCKKVSVDSISVVMDRAGFPPEDMMRAEIKSTKIMCEMCASTIKKTLEPLDGMNSVVINVGDKTVAVDFDSSLLTLDDIKNKMAEVGYTPDCM